jgi:hypothetical protein
VTYAYHPGLNRHLKADATAAYVAAKNRGELVPPKKCSVCHARTGVVGHHDDYARPLDVRWLCRKCHARDHYGTESRPVVEVRPKLSPNRVAVHANINDRLYADVVRLADGRTMRAVVESALAAWCVSMEVAK